MSHAALISSSPSERVVLRIILYISRLRVSSHSKDPMRNVVVEGLHKTQKRRGSTVEIEYIKPGYSYNQLEVHFLKALVKRIEGIKVV